MKAALIAIITVLVIAGALVGVKALQIGALQGPPPEMPATIVTTAPVEAAQWERKFGAIGSLTASQGVIVSAEVGGRVESIHFESGSDAMAGDLLVQLDVAAQKAQLRAAESDVALARREVERARNLLEQRSISTAEVDSAEAALQKAEAEGERIQADIDDRTIRAPFDGRLGIRQIDLGEVLETGAPIVSLQALDPIHIDFSLPQQRLADLEPGLEVRVRVDAYPGRMFSGKLTAINANLDVRSRSVPLQGTVMNPDGLLRPGMFAQVEVVMGIQDDVIMIPITSVLYSPFGDSVFLVQNEKPTPPDDKEPAEEQSAQNASGDAPAGEESGALYLRQANIRIRDTRGDFLAVTGVEPGQQVVTSGVFKLTNGMRVEIDNTLAPKAEMEPSPPDA